MWLINTSTLELEYFQDACQKPYAILSHTWENEEVSFQEMQSKKDVEGKRGYQKILGCCKRAQEDGLEFAWVDTCCIDKTSSAELSESINSMFAWYQQSMICYAYLADVHLPNIYSDVFPISRWFKRGWTLQELLAPTHVEFYSSGWHPLGSKLQMAKRLSTITGISERALAGDDLLTFNVAEKMSWASERTTTRVEDTAYCLLGIFGINMPLLYGEGVRAFARLQEQIIELVEDYSIFAWPVRPGDKNNIQSILAKDPSYFHRGGMKQPANPKIYHYTDLGITKFLDRPPPAVTSRGLRLTLPLVLKQPNSEVHWAYLGTFRDTQLSCCLPLYKSQSIFFRVADNPYIVHEIDVEKLHVAPEDIYCHRSNLTSSKPSSRTPLIFHQMRMLMEHEDTYATQLRDGYLVPAWTASRENAYKRFKTVISRLYLDHDQGVLDGYAFALASLPALDSKHPYVLQFVTNLDKVFHGDRTNPSPVAALAHFSLKIASQFSDGWRPNTVLFLERIAQFAQELALSANEIFAVEAVRIGFQVKGLHTGPTSPLFKSCSKLVAHVREVVPLEPASDDPQTNLDWLLKYSKYWWDAYPCMERLKTVLRMFSHVIDSLEEDPFMKEQILYLDMMLYMVASERGTRDQKDEYRSLLGKGLARYQIYMKIVDHQFIEPDIYNAGAKANSLWKLVMARAKAKE